MVLITQSQIQQLKQEFPHLKFKVNYPLSKITYFKVGGPADVFVSISSRKQLIALITYCRLHDLRFTILGGGSNVLVADTGIRGLVIATRHDQFEVLQENQPSTVVRVDSGMRTATLVKKSADLGLAGLGAFLGVPGFVGGAIYNNSHFQTELIGDYVKQVEVLTSHNDVIWLPQSECDFGYDQSRFQNSHEIILRVDFELQVQDDRQVQQTMKKSTLYRMQTQPLGMPSSGCIFKNVANTDKLRERFPQFADKDFISAGFLIDQAGLKGLQQGGVKVSHKHAAFMVNTGDGCAQDILDLIDQVKSRVKAKFGVELEQEVFLLE